MQITTEYFHSSKLGIRYETREPNERVQIDKAHAIFLGKFQARNAIVDIQGCDHLVERIKQEHNCMTTVGFHNPIPVVP